MLKIINQAQICGRGWVKTGIRTRNEERGMSWRGLASCCHGLRSSFASRAQLICVHVQPDGLHQIVAVTCFLLGAQRLLELAIAVPVAVDDVPVACCTLTQ